jgi:hypothetical protein
VDLGYFQCTDSFHQAFFSGYVISDSTREPPDMTFMQGTFLGREGLWLDLEQWTYYGWHIVTDGTYVDGTWGYVRCSPLWVNYSIWQWNYDTSQFALLGYRPRDPVNSSVGTYYASMVVPPPGHYEIRWRYQRDSSSYAREIVQPFTSLSIGLDAMRDYPLQHNPPAPPSNSDIVGLFRTATEPPAMSGVQ